MAHMQTTHRPTRKTWVFCALAGFAAGLLNGLLGAAGGILLIFLLPFLPKGDALARRDVLATAMAVMLPVSLVSAVFYFVGGVRPTPSEAMAIAIPAALGGLLGARLLGRLPEQLLRRLFAVLVMVAGIRMMW